LQPLLTLVHPVTGFQVISVHSMLDLVGMAQTPRAALLPVRGAYTARALHVGVMPYPNYYPTRVAVRDSKDPVKKVDLAVLDIAPQSEAA